MKTITYKYMPPVLPFDAIKRCDDPNNTYYDEYTKREQIAPVIYDYLNDFSDYFTQNHFYKFDSNYYNVEEFNAFVKQMKSNCYIERHDNRVLVIKGKAGVGKTTFLKLGFSTIVGIPPQEILIDLDFREIPQNLDDYTELIMERINTGVCDLISFLYREAYLEFYEKTKSQGYLDEDILRVLFLCKHIGKIHSLPLFIAFDNIDLCSQKTQESIVSSLIQIKERIYKCLGFYTSEQGWITFILTKRPETHFKREQQPFNNILFPLPRILNIYLDNLESSFKKSGEKREEKDINTTLGGVKISNISALTNYFIDLLKTKYFKSWDTREANERFGDIEQFHNQIVNSNVRRFIHFISSSIKHGALKPLSINSQTGEYMPYQLYQYIDLLIRGAYDFHPGNAQMDGEGFYTRSPIVMNLFDSTEWINDQEKILKNYFVYIRILQYIEIEYEKTKQEVSYLKLLDMLIHLGFDNDVIDTALKKLLYANIIDETRAGIRNIAMSDGYKKIRLEPVEEIYFAAGEQSTIVFYLKFLMVEPEYIFNMSVTAPLFIDLSDPIGKDFIDSISNIGRNYARRIAYCLQNKDRITYLFIKTIYISLQQNILNYMNCDSGKTLKDFKENFIYNNANNHIQNYKPWRRMIEQYISVLEKKKEKSAERNLSELISTAKSLLNSANLFFAETLGDI